MHALHGVLQRHRSDAGKAGEQCGWTIHILKRPESDTAGKEGEQQHHLECQQHAPRRQLARAQAGAGQPRQRYDQDELRQRDELADDAVMAEYQSGGEGDKVAGDVRGEQALQAKEACGVDKSAIE